MSGIFISYRREDSAGYVGPLGDALVRRFAPQLVFFPEVIFRDILTMGPGVDIPSAIARAVTECDVMLVLIGEKWLTAEQDGRRRLDNEDDYVRLEIAAGLDREILMMPLLVGGARMPSRRDLPHALAGLADRKGHRLTDERWHYDVDRLVAALPPSVQVS